MPVVVAVGVSMITFVGITPSAAAAKTQDIIECAGETAKSDPADLFNARSESDILWDKAFAETPREVYSSIIADIRASIERNGVSDLSFMDE
jgi:hypothetical protein